MILYDVQDHKCLLFPNLVYATILFDNSRCRGSGKNQSCSTPYLRYRRQQFRLFSEIRESRLSDWHQLSNISHLCRHFAVLLDPKNSLSRSTIQMWIYRLPNPSTNVSNPFKLPTLLCRNPSPVTHVGVCVAKDRYLTQICVKDLEKGDDRLSRIWGFWALMDHKRLKSPIIAIYDYHVAV